MDNTSSRQSDIQKMLFHIGEKVRYLLQSTTLIYKNNRINYSIIGLHEKVMRLIAPPFQLLGFDDEQDKEQENQDKMLMTHNYENDSHIRKQDDFISEKYERRHRNLDQLPKMPFMKSNYQNDYQKVESNKMEQNQKPRIFFGNNPTGVYRKIKQYQDSKGPLVKKSMKTLRHVNKFIMNYEENQARKNDPNRVPKRRPRKIKIEQDQQNYILNKDKTKRGRKVQDAGLEQKILYWFRDQISRGITLRKIDLRNRLRLMSGGRLSGSTGWCRRFLQRHPQIKTWFQKTYRATIQNSMMSVKTPKKTKKDQQGQEWAYTQNSPHSPHEDNSQESQSQQSIDIGSQFQPSFFNQSSIVREDSNKKTKNMKIQNRQNNKK